MSDFNRYQMVVTMDDGQIATWNISLRGGVDDPFVDVMRAMAVGAETAPGVARASLVRQEATDVPLYPPPPPAPQKKKRGWW